MIAGLLSVLLLLVRPDAVGAEGVLAAGIVAAAFAVVAALRALPAPRAAMPVPTGHGFAVLRVRLRASDPSAEGHRRARAPGTTR